MATKRVGGSRAKLYRCEGAVFDVKSESEGNSKLPGSSYILATSFKIMEIYLITNIRYALVVPRMQVQEFCSPRLPRSFIRIES